MSGPKQELLFHCFPGQLGRLSSATNISPDSQTYLKCGKAILESILNHGMILTPEEIKIRRHVGSEQEQSGPIIIPQTRASFTLSNLDALQQSNPFSREGYSHLDIFGHFSIGLDPIAARDFDMSPVFYYYDATHSKEAFPLIASLVHALTETREVLSILTLLEERSLVGQGKNTLEYDQIRRQFPKAKIRLLYQTKKRADRLASLLECLSPDKIAEVLPTLGTDRRPFWNLVEAIDLLSGLMQSADSTSLNTQLLYFSQHEWRLIKALNANGYPLCANDPTEPRKLREIRSALLESIYSIASFMGNDVSESWLHECWVLLGSSRTGKHFREYVRLIVCPRTCKVDVDEIVERAMGRTRVLPKVMPI